ncbi:MAG: CBS domain-containing protein [Thaumarchaeota archaeon]|nr:CBS domain-containing protein [Nitrososphaerota archaeon]
MSKTADMWWLFTRQTVTIGKDQQILYVVRLMVRRGFRHIPVTDAEFRLVGIVTAQDVIDAVDSAIRSSKRTSAGTILLKALSKPVSQIMDKYVIAGEASQSLVDSITMMADKGLSALPLVDKSKRVQGIVTLRDLVSVMAQGAGRLGLKVQEVMTEKIHSLAISNTILDAVALMAVNRIRRVMITADNGKSYSGIVTNKDVMRLLDGAYSYRVMRPEDAFKIKLAQVMDMGFGTIGAEEDVRAAAWQMMTLGFGGLVVMLDGPVGIITERDLIHRSCKIKGPDFLKDAIHPQDDTSDEPSW